MKTLLKPVARVLGLVILAIIYGTYLAPKMGTDNKSFVVCIIGWMFLLTCIALSTLPLVSALIAITEKESEKE